MKENTWVDFKVIKEAVSMQMVLDYYGIEGLTNSGDELRGPCPIHKGRYRGDFKANVGKNAFKCFSQGCGARGNVLDFVAAMEHCSVRDAALKLQEWFNVGDSVGAAEEGESVRSLTREQIESLKQLVAELGNDAGACAHRASRIEKQLAAVKEILATLED